MKFPKNYPAPSPTYLGPALRRSSGDNKPIHLITIHSTVGPTAKGSARSVAKYFQSEAAGGSAHYCVDAAEAIQTHYDSVIAWHAPPNPHSIGVEMCDYPDADSADRWKLKDHQKLLANTANLVADLCLHFRLPPYYLDADQLRDGEHGVTTHRQVSLAFNQSDHWDPGEWPRVEFMRAVRRNMREQGWSARR